MVNITYDTCESVLRLEFLEDGSLTHTLSPVAGSIDWYDADASPPATVVYNPGDIAWVLASTALVWIMVPGVGFFYSGLLRSSAFIYEWGRQF